MYTPSTSLFLSTFRQLMHLSSYLEHLNIPTRIVNISRLVYSETCSIYWSGPEQYLPTCEKQNLARRSTDRTIDKEKYAETFI